MAKIISLVFAVGLAAGVACAEEAKLGENDFVSSTVSDVFDKLGKVTSGKDNIFAYEEKDHRKFDPDEDPLGRKIPDPAGKPITNLSNSTGI
ncbi:MAG: hypothetical protein WC515_01460 [Candidatus Omnitrophota bacterium]